jgi:predicted esterase YcpF (UPF0227 family)
MISIKKFGFETTVIVFSGLAPQNHIFEWVGSFKDFPCNLIGIQDKHNSWYQIDFVNNLESLKSVIYDLKTKRLACVGGSAGGFGALWFGKILGASKIISFCPQSACGEIKRKLGDDRWPEYCKNTPSFDISGDYSQAIVYCAEDEELDIMHVERFGKIDLRKSKSGRHKLPLIMKQDGILKQALLEVF